MLTVALFLMVLAVPAAVSAAAKDSEDDREVLEFETMSPVVEPFTGTTNAIRGVPGGGGLPWDIDAANGELQSDGDLKVRVRGLVLARRDPVQAELQGTNPVPSFQAVVNCLTSRDGGGCDGQRRDRAGSRFGGR